VAFLAHVHLALFLALRHWGRNLSSLDSVVACRFAVLLRVHCAGMVSLSELPRPRLQALYLVLRLRTPVEDRHPRSPARQLVLALPRHRTTTVCPAVAASLYPAQLSSEHGCVRRQHLRGQGQGSSRSKARARPMPFVVSRVTRSRIVVCVKVRVTF